MKKSVCSLLSVICLWFLTGSSFADEFFNAIIAALESPSHDLRELYKQLDEYQENAQNPNEKFDAQLLLLNVLNKMDEEFLGKEAWDYEITPRRTKEFCSVMLEESQNQWQRTFAFLCLAINYMGDARTRELTIPVLTNAIAQIESLELEPDALSPVLAYLNEQLMKEDDNPNWHKTIFSGLLGIAYMEMERFDEAEQIQKNILSPYWQKILAELLQDEERNPQTETTEKQAMTIKDVTLETVQPPITVEKAPPSNNVPVADEQTLNKSVPTGRALWKIPLFIGVIFIGAMVTWYRLRKE